MLDAFGEVVSPMLRLREKLRVQNENLRSTRDLLLPRLVSGEIDVSSLDIDTEWLAS
jgi:type I restriction enzyme S subunit